MLSGHNTLPNSPHMHQPGSPLTPILGGGLMKPSLERHGRLNHWPLELDSFSSPSPLLRDWGSDRTETSNPPTTYLVPPGSLPSSLEAFQKVTSLA